MKLNLALLTVALLQLAAVSPQANASVVIDEASGGVGQAIGRTCGAGQAPAVPQLEQGDETHQMSPARFSDPFGGAVGGAIFTATVMRFGSAMARCQQWQVSFSLPKRLAPPKPPPQQC